MQARCFSLLLTLFLCSNIFGQDNGSHYLVEMEIRTPSEQDMVSSFEGFPSIPLQANDILGRQVDLMSLKGKTVILYFWELQNTTSIEQIDALNLLQSRYRSDLSIVSLANDQKADLIEFIKNTPVDFPIIPNSKVLSDGPYGGELGCPKIFIVDEYGIIKWVFPASSFTHDAFDTYKVLETLIVQLQK